MALRWLSVLVLTAVIALAVLGREARAQVFRPRTGKAAVVGKAAPATAAATPGKKSAEATATAGKPAAKATAPKRTAGKKRRPRSRDDDVKIDDDEDDVKITDD